MQTLGNEGAYSMEASNSVDSAPAKTTVATSTAPLRGTVIRRVEELESIRPMWTAWQNHPNSDFEHYAAVLASLPGVQRPHVIVAYRDSTPVALLAGRLDRASFDFTVGYRPVFKIGVSRLTFIHAGYLGESSTEVATCFMDCIEQSLISREGDLAYFNHLRLDSELHRAIQSGGRELSHDHLLLSQNHRAMSLPDSVDAFYGTLSPKVRKNQKWQAKRLNNEFAGEVAVKCLGQPEELNRMFEDLEQIAKKTYQRGLGAGFIDNAETRKLMTEQARRGMLRSHILYIQNKPVAFWIGVVYGTTFHSAAMGYDPQFAKYSPGMFLIMKVVEEMCSQRHAGSVGEIDFGFGDAQYKQILGTQEWHEAALYVYGPGMKGRALGTARHVNMFVDQAARGFLERTQLIARVKRVWRNRLRDRGSNQAEHTEH